MKARVNGKSLRIKDCRSPLRAAKGLMFSKLRNIDGALIRGNSVWMPFCLPLYLVFLDDSFNILKQMNAVPLTFNPKTWKTYTCQGAKYCLEINASLIKERIKNVEVRV